MDHLEEMQKREALTRVLEFGCDDDQLLQLTAAAGVDEVGPLVVILCAIHGSSAIEPVF